MRGLGLGGRKTRRRLVYDGAVGCPFDLYQGDPQKARGLNLDSQLTHSGGMTDVTRLGRRTRRPALTYINGLLLRRALDAFIRH